MKAIVYTSETGHSETYARLLGEATGLSVYPLKQSNALEKNDEVIYIGWLMGGTVAGYRKAAERFSIRAVCAVGMSSGDGQRNDILKMNAIADTPLFILQGGFELDKLHGIKRMMMQLMIRGLGKKLSQKPDLTAEEKDMLSLARHGENRANLERLSPVLEWYQHHDA